MKSIKDKKAENEYLWPMLLDLPYFRALLRAVEAGFYEGYDLPSPVLDLGCGDGQFASVTFENQLNMGLDPEHKSLLEAKQWGAYKYLVQSQGANMPFANGYFSSAISNSVLEHISDLQEVLDEAGRLLKSGAPFLFCVPNNLWPEELAVAKWLKNLGLRRLAGAYTRLFTRISRHVNILSAQEWESQLVQAGFRLDDHWSYFPPDALRALELGHYFGLPSLITRWLFGRWLLVPSRWNLAITHHAIQKHGPSVQDDQGTYTFVIARKL